MREGEAREREGEGGQVRCVPPRRGTVPVPGPVRVPVGVAREGGRPQPRPRARSRAAAAAEQRAPRRGTQLGRRERRRGEPRGGGGGDEGGGDDVEREGREVLAGLAEGEAECGRGETVRCPGERGEAAEARDEVEQGRVVEWWDRDSVRVRVVVVVVVSVVLVPVVAGLVAVWFLAGRGEEVGRARVAWVAAADDDDGGRGDDLERAAVVCPVLGAGDVFQGRGVRVTVGGDARALVGRRRGGTRWRWVGGGGVLGVEEERVVV